MIYYWHRYKLIQTELCTQNIEIQYIWITIKLKYEYISSLDRPYIEIDLPAIPDYILGKLVDSLLKGYITFNQAKKIKDLAFLILQFSGPALLDICHRTINLPSSLTAYRMMKGKRTIKSTIQTSPIEPLSNLKTKWDQPKYGHMLTFVDPTIR